MAENPTTKPVFASMIRTSDRWLQRAAAEAFALLALVAGQDVEPADRLGSHRPVVADRTKRRSRQGNFGCVSGSAGAGTHPRPAVTLPGDEG
jgi:hypothetical protein